MLTRVVLNSFYENIKIYLLYMYFFNMELAQEN